MVQPYGPSFPGVLRRLSADSEVQVCECASSIEAASVARKAGIAIIVAHISSDTEMVGMASLLKLLSQEIAQKKVRTVVTNKMRNAMVAQTLNKYGATEIIPEPVNERALTLKIDRHIRATKKLIQSEASAKKSGRARDSMERDRGDDESTPRTESRARQSQPQLKLIDPLTIEADFWTASEEKPKRIAGRWNIRLFGPPPAFGRWNKAGEEQGQPKWEWTSSDPDNDPFSQLEGKWMFIGQRPEFQGDRWFFLGKRPELAFVNNGNVEGKKLFTQDNDDLVVTRDSSQGSSAQQMIRNALQASLKKKTATQTRDGSSEKNNKDGSEESGDLELKRIGGGSGGAGGASAAKVLHVPALSLESDFWNSDTREPIRVSGRWSVKLIGPGPMVGRWTELETDKGTEQFWQWTPNDPENDPFIKEQGHWVFRGNQPRFDNDRWVFVGSKPLLAFYYEGESYGAKISTDEKGNLLLAEDSKHAKEAFEKVQATLIKVIRKGEKGAQGEDQDDLRVLKDKEAAKREGEEQEDSEDYHQIAGEKSADDSDENDGDYGSVEGSRKKGSDRSGDDDIAVIEASKLGRVINDSESESEDLGRVLVDDATGEPREGGDVLTDDESEQSLGSIRRKKRKQGDEQDDLGRVLNEEDAERSGDSGDGDLEFRKDKDKESKMLELNLGREKKAKELSATLDKEREGKELSLDLGREAESKELSAELDKSAEGQELSAELGRERESKELEYQGSDDESARGITDRTGEDAENNGGESAAEAALPEKPAEPVLSPIALAFLLSELMAKRGLELGALTRRYCTYLSAATHGRRVEFWADRADGGSLWVSSQDGKPGKLSPEKIAEQPGACLATVRGGKFVFGPLKGTDVKVSDAFLEAVSRISTGVGLAWREKFQPASGTEPQTPPQAVA
jgi:hypothetical protein